MSGRRRRQIKNDDEDDDDDDDDDSNEDSDSEYSEIQDDEDEIEEKNDLKSIEKGNIDEEIATVSAISISQEKAHVREELKYDVDDTKENVVKPPTSTQNKPKEILKRVNTNEEQQEKDKRDRERNSRKKEMKMGKQVDSFSQAQRKNPAYVPLSGNFFLHDDRDSSQLVDEEDDREIGAGLATLTEANLSKHTEGNLNRPINTQDTSLQRTRRERPNQRNKVDKEDGEDVWRHDKFEEFIANESNDRPDRDQEQWQGRGGRGRGGRGRGRGEGRGGRGRGGDTREGRGVDSREYREGRGQTEVVNRSSIPPVDNLSSGRKEAEIRGEGRGEGRPNRSDRKERVRGNVLTTGVFAAVQNRQIKVNTNTDIQVNEREKGGRRDRDRDQKQPYSSNNQAQLREKIQNLSGNRSAVSSQETIVDDKLKETSKEIMDMKEKIALKVAKMKANAKEFNPRSTPSSSSSLNQVEQDYEINSGLVASENREGDYGEQVQSPSSSTVTQSSSSQNLQHTYSNGNDNVSYSVGSNQGGISPVRYTQAQGQPVYDMNIQMQQERQQQMMQTTQNNYIDTNINMSYDNNRNYSENYIESYSSQGPGGDQMMYMDSGGGGMNIGVGAEQSHQVLLSSVPMGIDHRMSGMVNGEGSGGMPQGGQGARGGGTTYYGKDGVAYYAMQGNGSYGGGDSNLQYGGGPGGDGYGGGSGQGQNSGQGESKSPYGDSQRSPYRDQGGQGQMIGSDGLALPSGYEDMTGGGGVYYAPARGEDNSPNHRNSSYYPPQQQQQQQQSVPYSNYNSPSKLEAGRESGSNQKNSRPLDLEAKPFNPSATATATTDSTVISVSATSTYASIPSAVSTDASNVRISNDDDDDENNDTWKNVKTPIKTEISTDDTDIISNDNTLSHIDNDIPVHGSADQVVSREERVIENEVVVSTSAQELVQESNNNDNVKSSSSLSNNHHLGDNDGCLGVSDKGEVKGDSNQEEGAVESLSNETEEPKGSKDIKEEGLSVKDLVKKFGGKV